MSTTETEYRPMSDVMQMAVYTQTLAKTFDNNIQTVRMANDNLPAITIINAIETTKRSTFTDLRHQYLRQTKQIHKIAITHTYRQKN